MTAVRPEASNLTHISNRQLITEVGAIFALGSIEALAKGHSDTAQEI